MVENSAVEAGVDAEVDEKVDVGEVGKLEPVFEDVLDGASDLGVVESSSVDAEVDEKVDVGDVDK
eukprot:6374674-Amphidinium_carterae.1